MLTRTNASTQDQADPLERIAGIAKLIEASGDRNEALGTLAPEVVEALHEQQLFRMLLPRAYGGDETDMVTWFRALEALGRLDASTAWCVGQINGCAATASALAPEVVREIWSGPRGALGWGPPMKARADEIEGGHRLSGQWGMASGSRHCTWVGMMAPVFDAAGAPVKLPRGAPNRMFLAPVSAIQWIDNWNVVGLRATNSGGFTVNSTFVPDGFSMMHHYDVGNVIATPPYKFSLMSMYGIGFCAVALGIARSMLDSMIRLAVEKKPRLADIALRDNHHIQFQVGEAEARLRSARNFVETTVAQVWDAVVATGELSLAHRVDVRMATAFATHEAKAVAGEAWDMAGAHAIFVGGPFERRWRDINTVTQQLQGRKTHLQDVGAFLLGLQPSLAVM